MVSRSRGQAIGRIAVIGTYLPRQCGIATFTAHLCDALSAEFPALQCLVVPVNDREDGYKYSGRVCFELWDKDINSYRQAADFLNRNDVDVVLLQHEYGIFGGVAGSHILTLLRELQTPVVTTLHTVLGNPDPDQYRVLQEIVEHSDRLVVMSDRGKGIMQELYQLPADMIDMIHHGVPDVPFMDPSFYKDEFGVEGKQVLLTFGLLRPNKGVEHVIQALPQIVAKHPEVVYVVLGTTHPHEKQLHGEMYRLSLEAKAKELGVAEHVIFHNRFLELEELKRFIGTADIYITPYLDEEQSTSGPLAQTVSAGKAVVSTPYPHAQELLADNRGMLVPLGDPEAIADRIIFLLDHSAQRDAMRRRAYLYGRQMVWSRVASQYMETLTRAREERADRVGLGVRLKTLQDRPAERPLINLKHLQRLTDGTGILQHARFTVPDYDQGYTTDDNARALLVTVLLSELGWDVTGEAQGMTTRYLAFLHHAWNPVRKRFRNFLSYERQWLEQVGSEESHARAVWALGAVINRCPYEGLSDLANYLFQQALPAALQFASLRAWAFTLLGAHEYLRRFAGDWAARQARVRLAGNLLECLKQQASEDWFWFEESLTYHNAVLPHALLVSGHALRNSEMMEAALRALGWLAGVYRAEDGHFRPIGSNGFYRRGDLRPRFDQQPVEAQAMVSACLQAHVITGEECWKEEAERAFGWFLGYNDLRLIVYDSSTGGCRDALQSDRCNMNQGAEATVAFLLASLQMRQADSYVRSAETTT